MDVEDAEATRVSNDGFRHLCCGVPNLTSLDIYGGADITDYSPIGMCSQLRALAIADYNLAPLLKEVHSICDLEKLSLTVDLDSDKEGQCFELFCTRLRNLRVLEVESDSSVRCVMSTAASAGLASMRFLETFSLYTVRSIVNLSCSLTEVHTLRQVDIGMEISEEKALCEPWFRACLTRLESMHFMCVTERH